MTRSKSYTDNNPILYLIATPIGNLKEFTPRAIEVISNCDLIAAEDTRNAGLLLSKFNIKKPLLSLREHNEKGASQLLISKILGGSKVAYVSDAGYPGISDPGFILVRECINNNISVSVVAGSSAFLAGLLPSGIDCSHFYFYGFLPAKESEATSQLEKLKSHEETIIFYEAPHRIKNTLSLLHSVLGNRQACIGRELTKINEEFIRGSLSELVDIDESTLKGEMVIIIEGNKENISTSDEEIIKTINLLIEKGLSKKDAIEITSKIYHINKNKIYKFTI